MMSTSSGRPADQLQAGAKNVDVYVQFPHGEVGELGRPPRNVVAAASWMIVVGPE